jgi:hypothetical protein
MRNIRNLRVRLVSLNEEVLDEVYPEGYVLRTREELASDGQDWGELEGGELESDIHDLLEGSSSFDEWKLHVLTHELHA